MSLTFCLTAAISATAAAATEEGTQYNHTRKTFAGSVDLTEGEQILFVNDPADTSSGDNLYIVNLILTLDKKAVDVPPAVEDSEENPETADSIVAVIALTVVAGTALVVSKKR